MSIEYEATFSPVEIEDARARLKKAGAKLVRPEFNQKRIVFDLPEGHRINGGFVRVRDEGDKITLTLKIVPRGAKIEEQKEMEVTVSDYQTAIDIVTTMGCVPEAYEETRRERWSLDGADITIDSWPHLGTIVEVEGKSEANAREVSLKLGFDWKDAKFCSIGTLYVEKYGFGPADLAKKTGKMMRLVFEGTNPFV